MRRHRRVLGLLLVGLVAWGCAGTSGSMSMTPKPAGVVKPPTITTFFAADKGTYRDPIKVYLAAEQKDGAMQTIAVQVSQVGYGDYPSNRTYLKEGDRERFIGYLQWNAPGGGALPEGTKISISISVLDRWGNQSKEIVLPYEFTSGGRTLSALAAPFDQEGLPRLGYISTVIRNPKKAQRSGK